MSDNDSEIRPESMTKGSRTPQVSGEEDVEGHGRSPEAEPESMTKGSRTPQVSDDEAPGADGLK